LIKFRFWQYNKYYGLFVLLYLMMRIFEVLFDFIGFEEYNILKDIEMLWNLYIIYFIICTFWDLA